MAIEGAGFTTQDGLSDSSLAALGSPGNSRVHSLPEVYSLPELWHLLSLDAPTVAALWTVFLAHCAGLPVPWSCAGCLFVGVWILYAADRLLDARRLPGDKEPTGLEERHRFHWRYRNAFTAGICAGAFLLLTSLPSLGAHILYLYALPSVALGGWLLLVHARRDEDERSGPLPKELMVGVFFGLAITVPTVARAPALLLTALPYAGLFAGVCTLNCLLVFAWENGISERSPATPPPAHPTTRWATPRLIPLGACLILLALVLGVWTAASPRSRAVPDGLANFAFAVAGAALLLLLLHAQRRHVRPLLLRSAADAVLLTPLLFLHLLR